MSKCTCLRCKPCNGLGRLYHECYSEPQDEPCLDFDGSGLELECDECMWQREQDYNDEIERETTGNRSENG